MRTRRAVWIGLSWKVWIVFGTANTKNGKWTCDWVELIFFCPSEVKLRCSFMGQCLHVAATLDFPAKPWGHVFWIRRAKTRRNMMDTDLSVIGDYYNPPEP
jgi:hypothetical protein